MSTARTVIFLSDHTGITAEVIGKSLLSQFPDITFNTVSLPFVDSDERLQIAITRIDDAARSEGVRPLVFSTLTAPAARDALAGCNALVMDVYGHFLSAMMAELGTAPQPIRGRAHGMNDTGVYHARMDALNFSLNADDGLSTTKYAAADLILVGVSRSGKTPTSLYMAIQFGLRVANYPLTPEDFEHPGLPQALLPYQKKLRGLTLTPARLAQIRAERMPNSTYANLETCQQELQEAELRLREAGISLIDTTHRSIEEIASMLKHSLHDNTPAD